MTRKLGIYTIPTLFFNLSDYRTNILYYGLGKNDVLSAPIVLPKGGTEVNTARYGVIIVKETPGEIARLIKSVQGVAT